MLQTRLILIYKILKTAWVITEWFLTPAIFLFREKNEKNSLYWSGDSPWSTMKYYEVLWSIIKYH